MLSGRQRLVTLKTNDLYCHHLHKQNMMLGGNSKEDQRYFFLIKFHSLLNLSLILCILSLLFIFEFATFTTFKIVNVQDEAQKMYIDLVNKLSAAKTEVTPAAICDNLKPVPGLDIVIEDKILWIKLNKPSKYNALTFEVRNKFFFFALSITIFHIF